MSYTEQDLYQMNVIQLREVGKSLFVKGATNKRKEELIGSIIDKYAKKGISVQIIGDPVVSFVPTQKYKKKTFAEEVANGSFVENTLPDVYKGYVVISDGEHMSPMYSGDGSAMEIEIPQALIDKEHIVDGEYIEFKIFEYKGRRYVNTVLKIGKDIGQQKQELANREVVLADNVFHYIYSKADSQEGAIAVIPMIMEDEYNLLKSKNIGVYSTDMYSGGKKQDAFVRLVGWRLRQSIAAGKSVVGFVDMDRMYRALESKSMSNIKPKLYRIISSAIKLENGGKLDIVAVTSDKNLADELKGFVK